MIPTFFSVSLSLFLLSGGGGGENSFENLLGIVYRRSLKINCESLEKFL